MSLATNMNDTSNFFPYEAFDSDTNRRKNTATPCAHCLKAQLTCDGLRPCQSCYKRGLTTTCSDATRKKVKQQQLHHQEVQTPAGLATATFPPTNSFLDSISTPMDQFTDTAQLLNFSLADLGFGSETAGLEYGIIGNMLQNPLTDLQTAATTTATSSTATATTINGHSMPTTSTPTLTTTTTTTTTSGTNHVASAVAAAAAAAGQQQQQQQTFPYAPAQFSTLLPMTSSPSPTTTTTATNNHSNNHNVGVAAANGSNSMTPPSENKASPGPPTIMKRDSVSSAGSQPTTGAAGGSSSNNNNIKRKHSNHDKTPEAVYNNVRRPFNYAEGFHYLIQYVREKMGREDLMRISRALALFRPSFLALIMNLTEEDLVFMEKCLQRTLLEYEKLISFSGTPTVVWRRTGEICLVGKEFSLLTQWQRDLLLHKKTYIYELMDNGSAVEYWEKFATHAFDNTDKACTFSCILRTPTHKAVPCTFCFTIKRDIFDLPSVIVGNFLPLLS